MIPDPFRLPVVAVGGQDLQRALRAAVPASALGTTFCISNRADAPQNVVDATTDATCSSCGTPCWCSPSTRRMGPSVIVVCVQCVVHHLARARSGVN